MGSHTLNGMPQYGEEAIIDREFSGKRDGMVVEVGAYDGWSWSNSQYLIARGWHGILIEPHPTYAAMCRERYANNARVQVIEAAASGRAGTADLYPFECVSTLELDWVQRCCEAHAHVRERGFGKPIKVRIDTLTTLLMEAECPDHIDYLSIDCEGHDENVIRSLDLMLFRPRLISWECGGVTDPSTETAIGRHLAEYDYEPAGKTTGNAFMRLAKRRTVSTCCGAVGCVVPAVA
jgi:FkbM family methyltransferase